MELNQDLVERYADQYTDESELSFSYEEEEERLDGLPLLFEEEDWRWEDLTWIYKWKSNRNIGHFRKNNRSDVDEIINKVLNTSSVTEKVELLTQLEGVRVAMASAFLLFMDPSRYTVIDWRAMATLREAGYLHEVRSSQLSPEKYLVYLGCCRALSNEFDVSLRKLDRAIWVLGSKA